MEGKEILTEYLEDAMDNLSMPGEEGDIVLLDEAPLDHQHEVIEILPAKPMPSVAGPEGEAFVVSFSEDDFDEELPEMPDLSGFEDEVFFEEEEDVSHMDLSDLAEEIEIGISELAEEEEELPPEEDDGPAGFMLPGADAPIFEEVQEEEPEEEEVETNWVDDGDTSKFIDYLRDSYEGIPRHSGNSISGCERALAYLNKLNRDVSKAVRTDENNALDAHLDEIEDYRVKILQGMVALKNRIGDLKRKVREEGSQKKYANTAAGNMEDVLDKLKASLGDESDSIVKEAKSGKLQVVITPFERAITGILINSVVSAGHPFEDVYEYLKKKFDLTSREELAVLQIVMDMGFPVFKDRGTIGESGDGKQDGHGVDFIKNYFA